MIKTESEGLLAQKGLPDFENTRIAFQAKSDKELGQTARLFQFMNKGWLVTIGTTLGKIALQLNLPFVQTIIKNTIFKQFCGGVRLADCQEMIDHLNHFDTLAILDYGAEAKSEEEDIEAAKKELMNAIEFAASNNSVPVVVCKLTALVANEILEKKQKGLAFSTKEAQLYQAFIARIRNCSIRAAELGVGIFIDAEESWIQESIDEVAKDLMSSYNQDRVIIYSTYQMYRHDKLAQLKKDHQQAKANNYLLGAKLVRGAYMDKERQRAKEEGHLSPIQENKAATDKDYNAALIYCLDHYEEISVCNASHNVVSTQLMAAEILKRKLPINHPHLNFCQLQGMSDHLTFNLAQAGYNAAKYVVYGPVKEVAAYLMRRAEENKAVTGEMSRELQLIQREVKRRNM